MYDIPSIFACKVFNDAQMKKYLSKETYESLKLSVSQSKKLDRAIADKVAAGMKEWALKNGATHFTHWFQPLTGVTAEKHDSFVTPCPESENGIIMDFSGGELIKGEPDASSFPSGGLRATFEARGYTAWDPTSYAFIKDNTLCIPSVFCSYSGDILDKKTPLLRSMETVNKQALRIVKLFEKNENSESKVSRVETTAGPEQEYFLVDRDTASKRLDLVVCGRTLFGAKPPKGQELDDHYFGTIKPRVLEFMRELDEELWKLGVLAKTEHNEAAPSQHELAVVYSTANIAADHNQLVMEMAKKIAVKHGFLCLLHEKPFNGVNGSGKHVNWSLCTDTGENLFDPGDSPETNARFLLFLCAVIKAVDEYQDLLRACVTSASNDLRLGGNEAPPAIISVFLGSELTEILSALEAGNVYDHKEKVEMKIGVHSLPRFVKDTTDRNRTSPFAFTGNKFEFRMLGSSASVSDALTVLNTAVSEVLSRFADSLETEDDFNFALNAIIKSTVKSHKRIIFNGNNYSDDWKEESKSRGLCNLPTTVDAMPSLISRKAVELFSKFKVFTEQELYSRYEISLESYCKTLIIEGGVMLEMVRKDVLPAAYKYCSDLAFAIQTKKAISLFAQSETDLCKELSSVCDDIYSRSSELETLLASLKATDDSNECALRCRDKLLPLMDKLRESIDRAEQLVSGEYWKLPTYSDLLFSV